jgi:hypothetical protein
LKADAASPSAIADIPAWLDVDGRLHRNLHANNPTLLLIRPDGYVGYRCQPADSESLVGYMSRYLARRR